MARIRSIHPGLATDERFMSMSVTCKAAWPLLWTECDDRGVFEWKPIVLKARLLPADNLNFEDLLNEWLGMEAIAKYQVDDKWYGAVRNFCKFQRPKKPAYRFPIIDEFRKFIGLGVDSSPPVGNQFGTSEEKPQQMKEEGGKEPIGSSASAPVKLDPRCILFDEGLETLSELTDKPPGTLRSVLGRWLKLTADDAGAILTLIERCRGSPVADPIAWIERQLKPQDKRNGFGNSNSENALRALAKVVDRRSDEGRGRVGSAAIESPDRGAADSDTEPRRRA